MYFVYVVYQRFFHIYIYPYHYMVPITGTHFVVLDILNMTVLNVYMVSIECDPVLYVSWGGT